MLNANIHLQSSYNVHSINIQENAGLKSKLLRMLSIHHSHRRLEASRAQAARRPGGPAAGRRRSWECPPSRAAAALPTPRRSGFERIHSLKIFPVPLSSSLGSFGPKVDFAGVKSAQLNFWSGGSEFTRTFKM